MRTTFSGGVVFAMVVAVLGCVVVQAQDSGANDVTVSKAMAAEADPNWEVAAVKPSDPKGGVSGFNVEGREVLISRQTVEEMLMFGYGVHKKQLVNAPDWISTEK